MISEYSCIVSEKINMTSNKDKSIKFLSALLLLLATVIWGSSFVTQTDSAKHIETFTLMAYRSCIASVSLGIIIFIRHLYNRRKWVKNEEKNRKNCFKTAKAGVFCGVAFTLAAALQQMGIYYNTTVLSIDTAGRAGFLTALYIILVPITAMLFGKKCGMSIWIGAVFCLVGMYFLCFSSKVGFSFGDLFLIGCAFAFTAQILIIDMICYKYDSLWICFWQFFTAFVVSVPLALIWESCKTEALVAALPSMLYLGIVGSAIAYTIQIVAQKNLHPAIASLIMSFESVFATVSGVIFLNETMSAIQIVSCCAIFAGILIAQFGGYLVEFLKLLKCKVK